MTQTNCPCHNCICVPVCKHKKYFALTRGCQLIRDFIDHELSSTTEVSDIQNAVHRRIIYESLKPAAWLIDKNGWVVDRSDPFYRWEA